MKIALTALVASVMLSEALGQQDEGSTAVNTTVYYDGGTVGVNTDDMYYFVSAEYHQNITQSICFVDPVLPPDVVDQICPPGSGKMPFSECQDACQAQGFDSVTSCPINLAGCCDCPYFSFHVNNIDAGNLYDFEDNIAWNGLPGWFNLSIWVVLAASLLFLLVSAGRVSLKLHGAVVKGTRVVGLIGMFLFAVWILWYLIGLNGIAYQGLYVWTQSAVGIFLHIFFSALWMLSGIIQYMSWVRRRFPRFHRMNGWAFVASAVLSFLGLVILCLAPHISSLGGTIIMFFFGVYWMFALYLAIKFAIQRKIDAHRVWMTRHMFLGASVAFQRVFNVINDWVFKTPQYYVGSFVEPACLDNEGLQEIQVLREGQDPAIFNAAQADFLCNGVNHLYTAYSFSLQFIICLFVIGIGAAELWLYATGNRENQKSSEKAEVVVPITRMMDDMPADGKLKLHRKVEDMAIKLVERNKIAEDTVFLRFELPSPSDTIIVPLFGHVNLRKQGMARPRPYSPIKAMAPGHVSFYVRNAKTKNGLSNHMAEEMQIGDVLFLSGPEAHTPPSVSAILSEGVSTKTLILAAGTGISTFLPFFDAAQGNVHAIVLDKSKERSIGLEPYCHKNDNIDVDHLYDNIGIDSLYGREDYLRRVDEVLDSTTDENDAPWDCILICGPNAFNMAMKKHVARSLPRNSKSTIFAFGTDDR